MARIQKNVVESQSATDWGDTVPAFVREVSWLRWLGPLSAERRLTIGFCALAALLYLPWLGATGFWDPWEPHYGEVAREMIARGDYLHPWWESTWFFSKPALDLWLMAAGMLAVNTNGPDRWTGVFSEWGVRLPYTAITGMGAVLLFIIVTGEWHRLRRLHLAAGALIVLVICAPWYGTMFAFDGRDDEGKTFFERFIVHDHFKRLALGVHTTTPGGTFTYFVEQIGFDCFPWVFAFPGAAAMLTRVRVRPQSARERAMLFLLLWFLIGFAVFAFSATKFHHYALPVLAPLLFFCALWLEQLLSEGLRANAGAMFAGGLLYALVAHDLAMTPKHLTDMFVYNYDRPYPDKETDPRQIFTVMFYAGAAIALSPWLFDRIAQLWRLLRSLRSRERRAALRAAFRERLRGAPLTADEAPQDRNVAVWSLISVAAAFAVSCGWFHWRRLSPHWTQRDLFWEYYHQSTPDEPIGAYLMNWRGETFYSRNTVRQVGRAAPAATLQDFLNGPGARKWLLVEQARLGALRGALGGNARLRVVESRNNKFALTLLEKPEEKQPMPGPLKEPEKPGQFGAPP